MVEFGDLLRFGQRRGFNVPLNYFESKMVLREHHCLGKEAYIMPGSGPDGTGDDPLNAWFPQDATFEENGVSVIFICELLHLFFSRVG